MKQKCKKNQKKTQLQVLSTKRRQNCNSIAYHFTICHTHTHTHVIRRCGDGDGANVIRTTISWIAKTTLFVCLHFDDIFKAAENSKSKQKSAKVATQRRESHTRVPSGEGVRDEKLKLSRTHFPYAKNFSLRSCAHVFICAYVCAFVLHAYEVVWLLAFSSYKLFPLRCLNILHCSR